MSLRPAAVLTGFLGVTVLVLSTASVQAAPSPKAFGPGARAHSGDRKTSAEAERHDLALGELPGATHRAVAALERTATPRVVAHRGASAYAPENTLAAADKADELGIEWVENDVQRTKDGELVVLHDETLDRTTDVEEVFPDRAPWKVGDFTAEELAQLDAGSWFAGEFAGERIPTLRQFLDRVERNGQRLLLELKKPELYPGIEREILDQLKAEGWLGADRRGDLVVQSFDAAAVETVHRMAPDVTTGFIGNPEVSELDKYAEFADQVNPRHTEVTRDYVRAIQGVPGAHGTPLQVHVWTVDEPQVATELADMGVNGIISNRPDVVRQAVSEQASAH